VTDREPPQGRLTSAKPEKSYGELSATLANLRRNKTATLGLAYIAVLIVGALLAPIVSPYNPLNQDLSHRFQPPSFPHILGLDEYGRDIFSRVLFGARISLQVGIEVVSIALLIGILVGTISGYYGGAIDNFLMRLADVFLAFPGLVLALGITSALGPGLQNVVLALVAGTWPVYARVIRSQTLSLKNMDFVKSARAIGARRSRIIFSHVIPNSISSVIILATLGMGGAILSEAGLSFLGLGVPPPAPSWGSMVSSGQSYLLQAPHLVLAAGLAIIIAVLSFNLVGDGLRDALDPKLRT